MAPAPPPPKAALENIRTVAELEREVRDRRNPSERVAHTIAGFVGSIPFVIVHLAWFALWVLVNTRVWRLIPPFYPYPFVLLALIVSCEAVLLTTFVLIEQNHMSRSADHRN